MSASFRLSTVSVSSKDCKVLRSLISLSGDKPGSSWIIDADRDDGDAVVIDVDDPDGAAIWVEASQQARPAVALSKQRDFAAKLLLHKPIRSRELKKVLSALAEKLENPALGTEWQFLVFGGDDDRLPLAEHLRRHNWDQPIVIGGNGLCELVIDPGSGVWYASVSERDLVQLLQHRFSRDDARPLPSNQLVSHTEGLEQQNLGNLKWRAGLALSDGALHPDLAGGIRIMLPQIPLQALSDTAYSRQARMLIRAPLTKDELVEESGADRGDVAQFLNACHVCGFLLVDSPEAATV